VLTVLLLAGCADQATTLDSASPQPDPSGPTLSRLGEAVAGVDSTRTQLLAAPAAVITAATALDTADAASAEGARAAARGARNAVRSAVPAATTALDALPQQSATYQSALATLSEAAAPLEPAQKAALEDVVTAGKAEAGAIEAFGLAARDAWPAYSALDKAGALWLERATAGWYRTDSEAADAYTVLLRPQRAALDRARAALRAADAERRTATDRQRQALIAADAALAPLR
jgi:hypothetical protein